MAAGLADGILRADTFAHRGYLGVDGPAKGKFDREWAARLFSEPLDTTKRNVFCVPFAEASGDRGRDWSILVQLLGPGTKCAPAGPFAAEKESARASEIGLMIVKKGLDAAARHYGFPVVGFGDLKITDRRMFEDYWEIQASMRAYLHHLQSEKRPLSLAVFGAPGGGKNFGIKELAKSLQSRHLHPAIIEANVSQFNSVTDLARELRKVRDVSLSGQVPLVFFDEFDTFWKRRPFGWLQYFLAPMQDGEFGVGDRKIKFPHAIFVFVGGLNHSFEMFNGQLQNRAFVEAKGPDFVSRLAKHLDVLGIERERDTDYSYKVRRAVILRQKIESYHGAVIRASADEAAIEDDVIRAFLDVDRFQHGVRSLEAIVRASRVSADKPRLHWGTLPQPDQLEMHVAVREFTAAGRRASTAPL